MSENSWRMSAPSSWWSDVSKMINLCSEPAKSSSETLSFLSCLKLDISAKSVMLTSQSPISSLSIDATDKCEFSGIVSTLISIKELTHALGNLPHSGDIVVSGNGEDERVTVETEDASVSFTVSHNDDFDDDMAPEPPVVDAKLKTVPVNFSELATQYKTGSSMSQIMIGSEDIGYSPYSGSVLIVKNGSVQTFSISNSAVESLMSVEKQGRKRIDLQSLTNPHFTVARMDAFSHYCDEGTLGIDDMRCIILQGDGATMSITPLNTPSKNNAAVTYNRILSVLSPSWENREVDVAASAAEFFPSLSRAASVSTKNVKIIVHDTTVLVHGVDERTTEYPFTQELSVETTWHGEGQHTVSFHISPQLMKTVGGFIPKGEEINFSVSLNEQGAPWAMTVYYDDFDDKNPHNFFLLIIT